jgi:hypothetical protein
MMFKSNQQNKNKTEKILSNWKQFLMNLLKVTPGLSPGVSSQSLVPIKLVLSTVLLQKRESEEIDTETDRR